MTDRSARTSPEAYARLAGTLFLLEALTAVFGQMFVLGKIAVRGDAAATAANILGHETMFRLGYASSLLAVVFHIAWALLFYELLKPVNKGVSLLATFVILVGCALQALAGLAYAAPLIVLTGEGAFSAFTAEQLQALALLLLRLNGLCFNAYLVFFGVWCGLVGYLIFRSTFLPRVIGLLMMVAGLGYLSLLWPPLAAHLYPFNVLLAAPGEVSLLLWLLVRGVNAPAWKEATRSRPAEGPRATSGAA
jgi:hypothetical protein